MRICTDRLHLADEINTQIKKYESLKQTNIYASAIVVAGCQTKRGHYSTRMDGATCTSRPPREASYACVNGNVNNTDETFDAYEGRSIPLSQSLRAELECRAKAKGMTVNNIIAVMLHETIEIERKLESIGIISREIDWSTVKEYTSKLNDKGV